MEFQAGMTYYKELNEAIRASGAGEITVNDVNGQRYLGCGMKDCTMIVRGTPGNGMGQYLDGATIEVYGNYQEAVGDTMNAGTIIVHGTCGDAAGYGMRGGRIFVRDNIGYRAGIHMKAYQDKFPVLVVGGKAGSFLGEYQAGGLILVLGQGMDGKYPCGFFCGTGMHGGRIVLRCDEAPQGLPPQVLVREATEDDRAGFLPYIEEYCAYFGGDAKALAEQRYFVLTPNPALGYKRLYTYQ